MRKTDIDIKMLRAFLAAADEGSFVAASRRLDCSQATITQRVKALEDRLQARVLERKGLTPVRLTTTGRELLPDAEALVALHDRIIRRSRSRGGRLW